MLHGPRAGLTALTQPTRRSILAGWLARVVALVTIFITWRSLGFDPAWWEGLIAGVALLFIGWFSSQIRTTAIKLYKRIRVQRDGLTAAPSATVAIAGNRFALRVRNDGAIARFTAQIRILQVHRFAMAHEQQVLHGFWFGSRRPDIEIPEGLEEALSIGYVETIPLEGRLVEALALYFYNPLKKDLDRLRHAVIFPNQPRPELLIQVLLSASPQMLGGPLALEYWLTFEGLETPQSRKDQFGKEAADAIGRIYGGYEVPTPKFPRGLEGPALPKPDPPDRPPSQE